MKIIDLAKIYTLAYIIIGGWFYIIVSGHYETLKKEMIVDFKVKYVQSEIKNLNYLRVMNSKLDEFRNAIQIKEMEITAYLCIDPMENRYKGITKSGIICKNNWSVASWTDEISFGSLVIDTKTWKVGEVTDTGNMIIRGTLDIAVKNRLQAINYGRENRNIIIIDIEKLHNIKCITSC